jgi:hypothetical protein
MGATNEHRRRGRTRGLAIAATCVGGSWVLLSLVSRIEIWFTERAMVSQGGDACSSTGVMLYAAVSWIPALLAGAVGLALGIASVGRAVPTRWSSVALLINASLLAWQVLVLAGVLPHVRHPCLR